MTSAGLTVISTDGTLPTPTAPSTSATPRQLVWRRAHWEGSSALYSELASLFRGFPALFKVVADVADPSDHDSLGRVIVSLLGQSNRVLPLLEELIRDELDRARQSCSLSSRHSVFRGTSIISQLEKAYVRQTHSREYLAQLLGDLVASLVGDPDLDLEIDPARITNPDVLEQLHGESLEEIVARRAEVLQGFVSAVVARITDQASVARMPADLRSVARCIAAAAASAMGESGQYARQLISGFVVLRMFSPAIVSPESSGVLSGPEGGGVAVAPKARRNLVLIAKVLQCIANNKTFTVGKEEAMRQLNPFVSSMIPTMQEYFETLASPGSPHSPGQVSPPSPLEAPVAADFDLQSLFELHRILWLCSSKLSSRLGVSSSAPERGHSPPSCQAEQQVRWQASCPRYRHHHSALSTSGAMQAKWVASRSVGYKKRIVELLETMGPPPVFSLFKGSNAAALSQVLSPPPSAGGDCQGTEVGRPAAPGAEGAFDDLAALERAKFLYQGVSTEKGEAVFYLIANRLSTNLLQNVNALMSRVYKVMDSAVNAGPYILVVDMSWISLSSDLKKVVYAHLRTIWQLLTRNYKKNIVQVYIVHPETFVRAMVFLTKSFASKKLWRKVTEVYNWKNLAGMLELRQENVMLPEDSKRAITKSYKVVKVNAKGKRQERLLKFTRDSILNIDPRSHKIKNEKRLADIEVISCDGASSTTLVMKFCDAEHASNVSFASSSSTAEDSSCRTYVCASPRERDLVMQDVFTCAFQASQPSSVSLSGSSPSLLSQECATALDWSGQREFAVTKVGSARSHDRILKLTVDSLMSVDPSSRVIKHEISFAGVEDVRSEPGSREIVFIKYRTESQWRKLVCRPGEGPSLVRAIKEGVAEFKVTDDSLFNMEQATAESAEPF